MGASQTGPRMAYLWLDIVWYVSVQVTAYYSVVSAMIRRCIEYPGLYRLTHK